MGTQSTWGLISRVSSRTYRKGRINIMRALLFQLAKRSSSYSLDNTSNTRPSFIWNVKPGDEGLVFKGARNDAPQWWRQLTVWRYMQNNRAEIGLLMEDVLNDNRLRDKVVQQWLYRHSRAHDLNACYDVLPLDQVPNVDADHYYTSTTVLPQIKAEYEEKMMLQAITGDYDDGHVKVRAFAWFNPTRLLQIIQQKGKASGKATMDAHGNIQVSETIGGSLSRSAFLIPKIIKKTYKKYIHV